MDHSKSWAEVTKPNKWNNVVNDWPDLNKKHKNQLKQKATDMYTETISDRLEEVTKAVERLSTQEIERKKDERIEVKSKNEIRVQRQLRRKVKQKEKEEKRLEEKISKVREPKSQKVKVVNKSAMETYLRSQTVSSARQAQGKSKIRSVLKIDLVDLINGKVVKPVDKAFIQCKETTRLTTKTQCHKGKKREITKNKYVSKLKRSILLSRRLRNQIQTEVKGLELDVGIDLKEPQSSDEKFSETTSDHKSIVMPAAAAPLSNASAVQFSRKFRPYCDNCTTPELLSLTESLLRDIFRFQDRAYKRNEVKARSQKRYVVGFKESMRQLDIGKVKLMIIAPDLEQSLENGGITEVINEMKTKCEKSEVPYVFSLNRRQLGYVLFKKVPVSCVGILNYQGSEENSQKLLLLIKEEKLRFPSAEKTNKTEIK